MITVDTRGLSCPQPVVLVNNEIKKGNLNLKIMTDSEASKENISRLLNKSELKYVVSSEDGNNVFIVGNE